MVYCLLSNFVEMTITHRNVAQVVERTVRDREAAGSSPVIPTTKVIGLVQTGLVTFLLFGIRS